MSQHCIICGQYVELRDGEKAYQLVHVSEDEKGLVCDQCLRDKLDGGTSRGSCLFGPEDVDYDLSEYKVTRTMSGTALVSLPHSVPMICESHLDELEADSKDHTLDIERVLEGTEASDWMEMTALELIGRDESKHLEYKETYLFDVEREEPNEGLKNTAVQEICAFGNSEGGVLIFGVEDDSKEIRGLERDYEAMDGGRDEFELQLNGLIRERLGATFASQYVSVQFDDEDGKDICAVRVDPSPEPVLFGEDSFYIRNGSSKESLGLREAVKYGLVNWDAN